MPVGSDCAAALEWLLKMTYCDCKAGCKENPACCCIKASEMCNAMCGYCVGLSCTNVFNDEMECNADLFLF